MICNVCEGTGFKNLHQIPEDEMALLDEDLVESVPEWIRSNEGTDVSVCDCCGNGEEWYGVPGEHYRGGDHTGSRGPYAYNGGLCECH